MAKKTYRGRRGAQKKTSVPRQQASVAPAQPPTKLSRGTDAESGSARPRVTSVATPARRASPSSVTKAPPDWAKEYHYVGADLKRVGILAGTIFVGLIILSLVLR